MMQMGAMQGWQCPVCKRVLSPWTMECPCKGKPRSDTTDITVEWTDTENWGIGLNNEDISKHIPTINTYYSETKEE